MKNIMNMKKKLAQRNKAMYKGPEGAFTLIELLVVVAIIGLLSSVVMFSVNNAREKAQDTKRAEDLRQLQIAAELRILENVAIPTAANIDPSQFAMEVTSDKNSAFYKLSPETIVKYLTMAPNVAEATPEQYALSAAYYDALFTPTTNFFRSGATKPQDPQCVSGQPSTCYRAYYDNASKVLVIATTLRTKKHTSGYNVQYGIMIGAPTQDNIVATCSAIGFPVYSTAQSATNAASCIAETAGVSSIVQGVSTGRNITGATGTGSI
jgi:prepilin-type N-terminal cleavage/methylation domain-containing protein